MFSYVPRFRNWVFNTLFHREIEELKHRTIYEFKVEELVKHAAKKKLTEAQVLADQVLAGAIEAAAAERKRFSKRYSVS